MESLAADAIYTMTCEILATAAEMENHRLFLFGAEGHEVHLFLGFFL